MKRYDKSIASTRNRAAAASATSTESESRIWSAFGPPPTPNQPHFAPSKTNEDEFSVSASSGKSVEKLEAREGIEPSVKVLQTFALPLGDRAILPGQASAKADLPSNRDHSIASRTPFQHFFLPRAFVLRHPRLSAKIGR
jgi:hypothetical protein